MRTSNPRRVVHQGLAPGCGEPRRRDQAVIRGEGFSAVQRPRLVLGAGEELAPGQHAEQHPPGGQEMVLVPQLGWLIGCADTDPYLAGRRARAGQAALAGVGDLLIPRRPGLAGEPHRGPVIGQLVAGPGHRDRPEAHGVQRQEPDAGPSLAVEGVGAHVGLAEVRDPGGAVTSRRVHAHEERDQAHPGRPAEGVHREAARQEPLHRVRVVGPVQERQPLPPLPHDRLGYGEGAGPGVSGVPPVTGSAVSMPIIRRRWHSPNWPRRERGPRRA